MTLPVPALWSLVLTGQTGGLASCRWLRQEASAGQPHTGLSIWTLGEKQQLVSPALTGTCVSEGFLRAFPAAPSRLLNNQCVGPCYYSHLRDGDPETRGGPAAVPGPLWTLQCPRRARGRPSGVPPSPSTIIAQHRALRGRKGHLLGNGTVPLRLPLHDPWHRLQNQPPHHLQ